MGGSKRYSVLPPADASASEGLMGSNCTILGRWIAILIKLEWIRWTSCTSSGQKGAHQLPGHRHRIGKVELIPDIHVLGQHLPFAPPEKIPAFAAHADKVNLDTRSLFFPDKPYRGVDQVDVEAAAQTPVSGHQYQTDPLHRFSLLEEGVDVRFYPAGHVTQHHGEGPGIRPETLHALLGAPQFRRRDHVHGLGDLLGLLDRPDFAFDIL